MCALCAPLSSQSSLSDPPATAHKALWSSAKESKEVDTLVKQALRLHQCLSIPPTGEKGIVVEVLQVADRPLLLELYINDGVVRYVKPCQFIRILGKPKNPTTTPRTGAATPIPPEIKEPILEVRAILEGPKPLKSTETLTFSFKDAPFVKIVVKDGMYVLTDPS